MALLSLNNEGRIIVDDGDRIIRLDPNSWAVPVIRRAHEEAHEGHAYLIVYSALKEDTEFFEVRLECAVNPRRPHLTIHVESALASTIEFWKDTTKTHVGGNALTPLNREFESTETTLVTACHTPGGSQAGAATILEYLGSASAGGRADVGGATGSRAEFILARGGAYLFKFTSRANANALTIIFDWYEHSSND